MREVLDYFWDYRAKWKMIGIELQIGMGTIDSIDKSQRGVDDCLIEVIKVWLHGKTATVSAMSAALKSKCVGGGVPSAHGKMIIISHIRMKALKCITLEHHMHTVQYRV